MSHYTKTTPMSQAMRDAEEENVVMRKGREYDRLLDAATAAVSTGSTTQLVDVIAKCEASLRRQANEHARQWGL